MASAADDELLSGPEFAEWLAAGCSDPSSKNMVETLEVFREHLERRTRGQWLAAISRTIERLTPPQPEPAEETGQWW